MRILETRRAPNPRRVRIFLAEKGIDVAFEEFDMMSGALHSDTIRRLNPWMRVPILVLDDGAVVSESIAICRYFEALHPKPPLFGRTALEMAQVEMWNRRVELNFFNHLTHIIRHKNAKMAAVEQPQITAWADANVPKLETEIGRLDQRLGNAQFLAGDFFSVADITLAVAVDFMRVARRSIPDSAPHLKRWHTEVSARPSMAE